MITLSNSTEITVAAGAAIPLDYIVDEYGTCCCHKRSSSSVKLCKRGGYTASYSANVTGTAGDNPTLALSLGGEQIPGTRRSGIITAAITTQNLSASTVVRVGCCDYTRVSIVNAGTTPVTIPAYGISLTISRPCS